MIRTGKEITEELSDKIIKWCENPYLMNVPDYLKEISNKKWISIDDLLSDLISWLKAEDYKELKQCVEDFISELKEG